ncbi:glycoside hydrolase family 108 protein [Dokdonia ponticola]|uniref:Glycoside hydrolase family 108 protein n=1 Tax=Dokdonia ponticola TaxID=2041041 RepID=A0ABV9I411_9FLAO
MDTNIIHTIDIHIAHLATQETEREVLDDVLKSAATYIKEAELKQAVQQLDQNFETAQSTVPAGGGVTSTAITSTRNTTPSVSAGNGSSASIQNTLSTASMSSGEEQLSTSDITAFTGGDIATDIASSTLIGAGEVLPPAVGTTSQIYAGTQTRQITVPSNLQGNTGTTPTLEEVKKYVAVQLAGAEEGSKEKAYWTMLSNTLTTVTSNEEIKAILKKDEGEEYGEGFALFSAWYKSQTKEITKKENSYDWETVRTDLIDQIKSNILTDKAEKGTIAHWNEIITKLENPSTDVAQLFVDYEELFLVLQQLKNFKSLPEKITVRTQLNVYTDITTKNMYAAIGVDDIYTFLRRFPDERGIGVLKIFINVKGTETTFGTGALKFKANKFSSRGGRKANINWVIYNASGDVIAKYVDYGEVLTHTFTTYGDFIVEAYGGSASAPTLEDAKKSSLAKLKTKNRKSYMALTIKEPELIGIKPSKAKEYVLGEKATIEAQFDVKADNYPSLTWNHYTKKPEEKEYTKVALTTYKDKRKITDFEFKEKGYHYIEVISDNKTAYFGSAKKPIKVGGNYITSIKETLFKKPYFLYATNHPLLFTPATYKSGKGDDIPEESIQWTVLKDGKSTGFTNTGKTLKIAKTTDYAEGVYTIKVCVNDPILGKKYAKTSIEIIHPQVTAVKWADTEGRIKIETGFNSSVTNVIHASIPYFESRKVAISLYKDASYSRLITSFESMTNDKGDVQHRFCISDEGPLADYITNVSEDEVKLYFKIQGKGYTLKSSENTSVHSLAGIKVVKDAKIIRSYFTYNNDIISPVYQAVPYDTEVTFIAETVNMIGENMKIELYKSNKIDNFSGDYVAHKNNVVVDTDGKIVVAFKLEKKWMSTGNKHPYFYAGVEKEDWSWFSTEKDSLMLRSYMEGEVLEDHVKVVRDVYTGVYKSRFNDNINHIFDVEGGYADDKDDKGGKTNMGVTYKTYEAVSKKYGIDKNPTIAKHKKLSTKDAKEIYKIEFWNKVKADEIYNASVALYIFDFAIHSGVPAAVKEVQKTLKNDFKKSVSVDGNLGEGTLNAINSVPSKEFYIKLDANRKKFIEAIIKKDATQTKYEKGWANRLKKLKYKPEAYSINQKIANWLKKDFKKTPIKDKNSTLANLILEAHALNLVEFNSEGQGNSGFRTGFGGTRDTFVKIRDAKKIGVKSIFDPQKIEIPILETTLSLIKSNVKKWVDNGYKPKEPNKIKLGSFMVWNTTSASKNRVSGQLRTTNHGKKAKAIDINLSKYNGGKIDFSTSDAEKMVYEILCDLPKNTYEIGLPAQGQFFPTGYGNHVSKINNDWAYKKIKSKRIKDKIEELVKKGYVMKVITDYPNHLHVALGIGGKGYMNKSNI